MQMKLQYFLLLILFSIIKMQIVQTQECTDIKLPNNIVVKRGSRAVLECSAQILIWTKNEKTINTGSENDCSCVIGNCGDLVFSSITDQDAGPSNAYRCRIYNQTSEISETAYICIEELPVFPNFFAPFQGTEGKLYTITLDYSGTCEPLTKIDLLKGSESVENDSNIQLEITDTSVIISFSTLTLSDQASYTLTSENKAGIATTSVGLIVKHKPIFLEKNVFPGSLLLANSTATLSCNYTGYPMVTITWYDPDGVEITEGITTESIGRWKYSELELKRLSQSDAGSYTCSASNQVGSTINTINIQVTSPMSIPWVSDIGSNQVRVSWDEPSEDYMINKYRVDYKKAANGISMWLAGGEVLVGTQQTTINNLQGNTYYMVRIVYFASVGQFYGSPIQFKTLHRAPTNSPDNLQGITISNSILEYNWNKPAQAYSDGDSIIISYRLWWTSTEENYESVLVDGTITRYTLMGLLASTKYSVKVQAYTEGGFGPNSTIIEVVTYADTFEFPSLLLTKKMVDLSWIIEWALEEEPNVEIQYYIILLRYSGEIFYEIGPLSSNITSYNFSNLDGTKYSKVCIEVEASGILQSRNCTELYVTNENRINPVNLAVWIATPIAGIVLFVCVVTTLLCGLIYACRTERDEYINDLKKVESDQSISSKISMNARHPYTGEPLPQAPRSCLKYHSDRGDPSIKLPKQLRIGTEL